MFFKDKSLKKYNIGLYLIFGLIGGLTIAAAWFVPDTTMKVFLISALFAILLTMSSLIVSRGLSDKDSQQIKEINKKLDNLIEKLDENKPTITKICMPKPDISQLPHIIKEWEIVIQTQMHFNDLIMKVRTTTLSVVLAVFGAAGYSFAAEKITPFSYNGIMIHPSAFIISSGIAILIAVFVVDYGYYYKMLTGAVKRGYEFDVEFQGLEEQFGRRYFGMSSTIRDSIGKTGKSKSFVALFYIIPILGGIAFLLAVLIGYQAPSV